MLNDMVAYMQNQGSANDGKHANLPSLMWCAVAPSPLMFAGAHIPAVACCMSDMCGLRGGTHALE